MDNVDNYFRFAAHVKALLYSVLLPALFYVDCCSVQEPVTVGAMSYEIALRRCSRKNAVSSTRDAFNAPVGVCLTDV